MRPGQYPTIEEVRWRRSTLFKPELQKRLMQLLKPTLFGFTNHIIYEKIRADLKAVAVHSFIPVRDDLKSFLLYAHIQQRRGKRVWTKLRSLRFFLSFPETDMSVKRQQTRFQYLAKANSRFCRSAIY